MNASAFMSSSGGRFAKPSEFEVVQKFFASSTSLQPRSYSLNAMLNQLGLLVNATSIIVNQKEFADGGDYLERVFVFNNTEFKIEASTSLRFVVDMDGTRHIQNLKIVPQTDNFDFTGGDLTTNTLNTAIRPFIDPSNSLFDPGLGRKVIVNFTGSLSDCPKSNL